MLLAGRFTSAAARAAAVALGETEGSIGPPETGGELCSKARAVSSTPLSKTVVASSSSSQSTSAPVFGLEATAGIGVVPALGEGRGVLSSSASGKAGAVGTVSDVLLPAGGAELFTAPNGGGGAG